MVAKVTMAGSTEEGEHQQQQAHPSSWPARRSTTTPRKWRGHRGRTANNKLRERDSGQETGWRWVSSRGRRGAAGSAREAGVQVRDVLRELRSPAAAMDGASSWTTTTWRSSSSPWRTMPAAAAVGRRGDHDHDDFLWRPTSTAAAPWPSWRRHLNDRLLFPAEASSSSSSSQPGRRRGRGAVQWDDGIGDDEDAVEEEETATDELSSVEALMPLVWTLRFFVILPISTSHNGSQRVFTVRWLSWVMAYTVPCWLLITAGALLIIRRNLAPFSDGGDKHYHLWDVVPVYAGSINMAYIVFIPYACWASTPMAIAFLESWLALETEAFQLLDARPPTAKTRRRAWTVTALGVGVPLLLEALSAFSMHEYWTPWLAPSSMHASTFLMLGVGFWKMCCIAFSDVATTLQTRMPGDVRHLGVAGLRAHRRLWQGLARTLTLMAACWARTHLLLLACTFMLFTIISFMFIHFVVHGVWEDEAMWLGVVWLLSVVGIASICNGAHLAAAQMHGPFVKQLMWLSLRVRRDARNDAISTEITQFLDDIRIGTPEVSLNGLAVLRRSSILSILALGMTYLVVLSQFTISSESAAQGAEVNFTEILG